HNMAESIAIHFIKASWKEINRALDEIAQRGELNDWRYPENAEPHVRIYPYDSLLDEYENEDIDQLFEYLDDFPSSTLCIELRRSQGNKACDSAAIVSIILLERFAGVVDDLYSQCWALEEIKKGVKKKD